MLLGSSLNGLVIPDMGCLISGVVDLVMIVVDVVLNAFKKFKAIVDGIEVYVIVFQRLPEPLYPDIIQGLAFTVHGDQDALLFQVLCPQRTVYWLPMNARICNRAI